MRIDCTDAERARFAAVCRELTAAPSGEYSGGSEGIGVLREKRLHAVLKRFVCPDVSFHEQTPQTTAGSRPESGAAVGKKQKKYVADVLCATEIYETQTGAVCALRDERPA